MKLLSIFAGIFMIFTLSAQTEPQADWVQMMQDPDANFYQTQQAFEAYWENKEVEKGKGFKQFKRWEAFLEPRVYPTGERPDPAALFQAKQYVAANFSASSADWKPLGPFNGNALNGIGRVNRLVFHPTNAQIIFACTAAGGLWKTINGGTLWTTNTDLLTNLGSSDLLIDPTNTDIMYLATGDRDGGDTYSFGILKTTDGGVTWNASGLSFAQSQAVRVSDLYMHPQNSDVIIASTRSGIYRSTNAGVNWQLVQSGSFNEVVQKPNNPNVLYTSTITNAARIYRSTNNGVSWSAINSTGLPSNGVRRIEIAVTDNDSNYVYALMGATNNGFYGLYRSTDGGTNWTQRSNSPNLMGWSTTGSDNGGQAWYDLALAVDPTDKNRLYTGGVNIWTSSNGGTSWSLAAHWFGGGGAPFVHADIHDLEYSPTGQLWSGNDGGIYSKSETSNAWSEHNDGINITQYYKIGAAANDTTRVIAGAQDNGTHLMTNPQSWGRVRGGDGMDCAISSLNSNVMYNSVYYGDFRKSTNGGNNFNANFNLPPSGNGNWVTPITLDPKHPDTIYTGFSRVWRSYNGGASFSAVSPSNLTGGANIDVLTVAPNHTNVLYISEGNDFWISEDRGATWVNHSSKIPGNNAITGIAVSHLNPKHVAISRSGYGNSQKVYTSTDGGFSWTNLSGNLPNIPANCVTYVEDNSGGLYVGTDAGVFYKDKNMTNWVAFNSGLPNVIVNELEINYVNLKMRAGTYGRGVWESDLFGFAREPVASINVAPTACLSDTVLLKDASSYKPNAWQWHILPNTGFSFVGGTNANSQNPKILFSQTGIYNVALSATNGDGSDSTFNISAISVGGLPLPYAQNFETQEGFEEWENPVSAGNKAFFNASVVGNGGLFAPSVTFRNTSNIGDGVELVSPSFNFSGHDSVWLNFDYAYTSASNNNDDSIKVYASGSCSNNWVLIAKYGEDGTNNFVTRTPDAGNFIPQNATDWCGNTGFGTCKAVDLSSFSGNESVRIKLVAVSGGGNAIYLDNINISGRANAAPTSNFSASQNVCAQRPLAFVNQSYGSPTAYAWTFTGGTPATSTQRNPNVIYTIAGTYEVKLKVSNGISSDSITKTNYVTVDGASLVSASLSIASAAQRCVGDTLTVNAAVINEGIAPLYDWYVNNTLVATTNTAQYDYTGLVNGDLLYCVLISSESCAFPQNAISDTVVANYFVQPTLSITSSTTSCTNEVPFALTATPAGGTFSGNAVNNGMFDPNMAGSGNHSVMYTLIDANGCTTTSEKIIAVNAPATINFTLGDFCEKQGLVLLNTGFPAGGNYSGTAIKSNYLFTDSLIPGTYTITYSFATIGCAPSSQTLTYNLLATPAKPQISQLNDTLFANKVSGMSYQWYIGNNRINGATQDFYVPTINSNYSVEITNAGGCSERSDVLGSTIGLVEQIELVAFEMYPNPTSKSMLVNFQLAKPQPVSLEINNLTGQLIKVYEIENTSEVTQLLDLENLPTGVYLLNVVIDGKVISKKFSKM